MAWRLRCEDSVCGCLLSVCLSDKTDLKPQNSISLSCLTNSHSVLPVDS